MVEELSFGRLVEELSFSRMGFNFVQLSARMGYDFAESEPFVQLYICLVEELNCNFNRITRRRMAVQQRMGVA